ncbi:MAG TPA: ribosome biogenesis GTPase Der [Bryobacteraceae bacterium]|nr:ribosome biogenesis GTPase Der [Bryobacteraceae bacterium]
MPEPETLPAVVIVGRPNVGKSTLFNAITRQRRAIVGDEPGITRDRLHGFAEHQGRRFELIDTGGIIPDDSDFIPSQILKQARHALEQAAHVIFLIDGRTEITGADRDLAKLLRQLGKPVSLAVNKVDTVERESLTGEFYSLGISDVFPVSAEHRLGIDDLLDHVTRGFARNFEQAPAPQQKIKVAIIGRPNVGKSTLLNALVGEERAIVSPIAGTTRDAVDVALVAGGVEYVFVDTAGIRRKGKTHLMAEKLSVVMARRHIRMANVVLLILDATEGVVGSDATIAGYAHEEGRAVILCANKWDAAPNKDRAAFEVTVRDSLKFLDYAPVMYVSGKTGLGVTKLLPQIRESYEAASKRVPTGELNRFVDVLKVEREPKIYYMTQASVRPPTFVMFTDRPGQLHFSKERFFVNQIRKRFGFEGTPIVLKTKARSGHERKR